jgi:hypothetical protein
MRVDGGLSRFQVKFTVWWGQISQRGAKAAEGHRGSIAKTTGDSSLKPLKIYYLCNTNQDVFASSHKLQSYFAESIPQLNYQSSIGQLRSLLKAFKSRFEQKTRNLLLQYL